MQYWRFHKLFLFAFRTKLFISLAKNKMYVFLTFIRGI